MGKELINNSVIFSISLHEIVNQRSVIYSYIIIIHVLIYLLLFSNNITFSTIITLLSDKPYREHLYTFLLNYKANPSYVLENLIRFGQPLFYRTIIYHYFISDILYSNRWMC